MWTSSSLACWVRNCPLPPSPRRVRISGTASDATLACNPRVAGFFFEETSQHYPPLRLSCLVEGSQVRAVFPLVFSPFR